MVCVQVAQSPDAQLKSSLYPAPRQSAAAPLPKFVQESLKHTVSPQRLSPAAQLVRCVQLCAGMTCPAVHPVTPIAAACRHDMPSCCSCDSLTDCNLCLQGAGQTIKHLPPLEARLGHAAGAPVSGKVCLDLIRKAGSISGMWERAAGYDSSDFGASGSALHPNFVTDYQGFAHLC